MQRAEFELRALEHLDAVHRLALQLTRRPEEAADLVQETYLRALRSADSFEERGGGIRPWLFTIAHNLFITRRKREARAPSAVGEFFDADPRSAGPDEPPPAWDLGSLDWEHVDERLKKAIDELSPEHRETLLLWGVEGMKYREIADVLETPIGTVMSRLHRARRALAAALEPMRREMGLVDRSEKTEGQ